MSESLVETPRSSEPFEDGDNSVLSYTLGHHCNNLADQQNINLPM